MDLVRQFLKDVQKAGIINDIKKHSFYLSPGEKRRLKHRLALRRLRKMEKNRARYEPG